MSEREKIATALREVSDASGGLLPMVTRINLAEPWPFQETTMANGTQVAGETTKGPRGRKNADKQEAVIEAAKLKEKLSQLVKLKKAADEAAADLNDALKATAEKSGLLASVVRKIVVASAGENFEEKKREAAQLSLAFDEVDG